MSPDAQEILDTLEENRDYYQSLIPPSPPSDDGDDKIRFQVRIFTLFLPSHLLLLLFHKKTVSPQFLLPLKKKKEKQKNIHTHKCLSRYNFLPKYTKLKIKYS